MLLSLVDVFLDELLLLCGAGLDLWGLDGRRGERVRDHKQQRSAERGDGDLVWLDGSAEDLVCGSHVRVSGEAEFCSGPPLACTVLCVFWFFRFRELFFCRFSRPWAGAFDWTNRPAGERVRNLAPVASTACPLARSQRSARSQQLAGHVQTGVVGGGGPHARSSVT